ncbi:galanin receptor 2b-like [Diadema setosum]|uniref:galanin receptor 2b-like n=1 Tax=Diadema setosum TaxID=31175 RepID=UPI003B3A200B
MSDTDVGELNDASLQDSVDLSHSESWAIYSFSSYFQQYDWNVDLEDRFILNKIAFFVFLALIVVGALCNGVHLYSIVAFERARRLVENVLIGNLLIADLLYLSTASIANLMVCGYFAFVSHHVIPMFIIHCFKILELFNTVVLYQIGSMITVLAVDYYVVVTHPITARKWRSPRNAFVLCIILWIAGVIVAVADGLTFLADHPMIHIVMLIKDSLIVIFLYLVPVTLTTTLHICVCRTLWSARRATGQTRQQHSNRFAQMTEADGSAPGALVRAQEMPNTTALFVSFLICWAIYHTTILVIVFVFALKGFDHPIYENNKDEILTIFADMAVHFNVALNPLFYAAFNPKAWRHISQTVYVILKCNGRPFEDQTPLSDEAETA